MITTPVSALPSPWRSVCEAPDWPLASSTCPPHMTPTVFFAPAPQPPISTAAGNRRDDPARRPPAWLRRQRLSLPVAGCARPIHWLGQPVSRRPALAPALAPLLA